MNVAFPAAFPALALSSHLPSTAHLETLLCSHNCHGIRTSGYPQHLASLSPFLSGTSPLLTQLFIPKALITPLQSALTPEVLSNSFAFRTCENTGVGVSPVEILSRFLPASGFQLSTFNSPIGYSGVLQCRRGSAPALPARSPCQTNSHLSSLSAAPTSANPRSSTASPARAAPSSRTSPASLATASTAKPNGAATRSKSWTPAASSPTTKPSSPRKSSARRTSPSPKPHCSSSSSIPTPASLRSTRNSPFFVAVNKVDSPLQESLAAEFHALGAPGFPVSAEHGTGVDDLLDAAFAKLEPHAVPAAEEAPQIAEIAIIGRANVGKSTLLNRLAGEERSIVSPIPGTTMDSVDTDVLRDGRHYRFVDTAGIRRKGKTKLVAEKLSVVMARRGLERADVALLVVDGEQGVTQGDATIASYAEQSGRSVIIVVNKWDLAVEAARKAAELEAASAKGKAKRAGSPQPPSEIDRGTLLRDYEELIRKKLKFLSYAPVVFLSAKTGERAHKLFPLIDKVAAARHLRIPTPELNRWLKGVDLQRGTTPKARPIRIY